MACAANHLTEMTPAAAALIEDLTVPAEISEFMAFVVRDANNPLLARIMVRHILDGRFFKKVQSASSTRLSRAFETLNPEQMELFAAVVGNAMVASAHADLLHASKYLRVIKWGLLQESPARFDRPQKARDVAIELQRGRSPRELVPA
jgi:hypothetical protein